MKVQWVHKVPIACGISATISVKKQKFGKIIFIKEASIQQQITFGFKSVK
jgi:hypothetical protein